MMGLGMPPIVSYFVLVIGQFHDVVSPTYFAKVVLSPGEWIVADKRGGEWTLCKF
jgi:hypothetical protein